MEDEILSRRDILDMLARSASLPAAALFLSAWLKAAPAHVHQSGLVAPPQPDLFQNYKPQFFSNEDFGALQAFTEILIPTDENPGAKEAHCAHFIDFLLQASTEMPQVQANWYRAMKAIRDTGFHPASPARQAELVTEMSRPEHDHTADHPAFFAYRLIKQQTSFAFFTSRVGLIDTLNYKGNSYNLVFPGCNHPEHQTV